MGIVRPAIGAPEVTGGVELPVGGEIWEQDSHGGGILALSSPYEVDLISGFTYLYDSNTTQLAGGKGASIGIFDFGFNIGSRDQKRRGGFWDFKYLGKSFTYEDSIARADRDALDHRLGTVVGFNGGKTRIRLSANYFHNNGNGVSLEGIDREGRRAQSDDFDLDATIIRDLPRGSVEFGAGHTLRDFRRATLLNDGSRSYGDIALYYRPGFAPKTELGAGLIVGEDDYQSNLRQEYVTPSARWRWRASGKTSVYGSAGVMFRDVEGSGGVDSDSFVYRGGVNWAPTSRTGFDLEVYSDVNPSYTTADQSYENTGMRLRANRRLPGGTVLSGHLAYESADYFETRAGAGVGRLDDYYQTGLTLTRNVRVTEQIEGDVSVFYHFNTNVSDTTMAEFDQHLTGFRLGFTY